MFSMRLLGMAQCICVHQGIKIQSDRNGVLLMFYPPSVLRSLRVRVPNFHRTYLLSIHCPSTPTWKVCIPRCSGITLLRHVAICLDYSFVAGFQTYFKYK